MRNFEQRIAEINRRSEEILKLRRQHRKHSLIACIPMVLCTTLIGVAAWSGILSGKGNDFPTGLVTELAVSNQHSCDSVDGVCVFVSASGTAKKYAEEADATLILDMIQTITTPDAGMGDAVGAVDAVDESLMDNEMLVDTDKKENYTGADVSGNLYTSSTNADYVITVMQEDRGTVNYHLAGMQLSDGNKKWILSPKQLKELTELLKISD